MTRPSSSVVQGNQRIIESERAEEEDGLGENAAGCDTHNFRFGFLLID